MVINHPDLVAEAIAEPEPDPEPEPDEEESPCCGFCGVTASPINKLIMSNRSEQYICMYCVGTLATQVCHMEELDTAGTMSQYKH